MKDKTCYGCGKTPLEKNEFGLNQKLLGSKVKIFYCYDCLAEYLEVDTDFLFEKIEEFKEQGCTLF